MAAISPVPKQHRPELAAAPRLAGPGLWMCPVEIPQNWPSDPCTERAGSAQAGVPTLFSLQLVRNAAFLLPALVRTCSHNAHWQISWMHIHLSAQLHRAFVLKTRWENHDSFLLTHRLIPSFAANQTSLFAVLRYKRISPAGAAPSAVPLISRPTYVHQAYISLFLLIILETLLVCL